MYFAKQQLFGNARFVNGPVYAAVNVANNDDLFSPPRRSIPSSELKSTWQDRIYLWREQRSSVKLSLSLARISSITITLYTIKFHVTVPCIDMNTVYILAKDLWVAFVMSEEIELILASEDFTFNEIIGLKFGRSLISS